MPPKGSRKRSRTTSRSRSSSPLAPRTPSLEAPVSIAAKNTSQVPSTLRHVSEWEELHDRAVLALKPTETMVESCLSCTRHTSSHVGRRSIKVAAFDLDDTIIMPKTGKVFPKDDPDDWRWLTANVPEYLAALHAYGFLVVLLSNQSGIFGKGSWQQAKADSFKEKVVRVGASARIPLSCLVSTQSASPYRKPGTGLWGVLQEAIEAVLPASADVLDVNSASFYVGDAAGRRITTLAGRKKDFSCSDRALAANLGLPFFTPEQFFQTPLSESLAVPPSGTDARLNTQWVKTVQRLEEGSDIVWDTVSPAELRALPQSYEGLTLTRFTPTAVTSYTMQTPAVFARPDVQEMILFVGHPGCGKSTFFRRFFQPHGYVHINRDTLKTKEKCFATAQACWKGGKSVVIDNTNPSAADRLYFSSIVRDSQTKAAAVRVFEFVVSRGMSVHLNKVRSRVGGVAPIPTMAYNIFHSKHEPVNTPEQVKKEGLTSALQIPAVADFDGLPPAVKKQFFVL